MCLILCPFKCQNLIEDRVQKLIQHLRPFCAFGSVVLGLALTGCASTTSVEQVLEREPPAQAFGKADALLDAGRYQAAAKRFESVDRDYPYAPEARRAMALAAFSYYKAGMLPEALIAAERYKTLHPGTKEAALAHHIIASAHYDQIKTPNRDQSATRKALRELKKLRTQFPNSQYAEIAESRIRAAEDTLAAHEMEVGRYYLKRNNHVAAINRFKVVARDYQTTAHVEESLMRLTESYMALGIRNEAQTAAAVLGHNFPNSRWYKDAYTLLASDGLAPREDTGSWLSQAWKSLPSVPVPSLPSFSLGGPSKQ